MKTRVPSLILLFGTSLAVSGLAAEKDLKTFDAVWKTVQRSFYDRGLHGVDWDQAREVYRPLLKEAETDAEARELLLDMLALLNASHTTIVDGPVFRGMAAELVNRRTLTFGLLLEESLPGRYFVRALYEGGPAAAAGLRMGDRIVAVDGVPVEESPEIVDAGYDPALPGPKLFFLGSDSNRALRLTVQPHPDVETRHTLLIRPVKMNAVDAAQDSVRVVEREGVKIGTLHIWFCSEGVSEVLRDAVTGELADCDALVLDIRGRGGYAHVVDEILDTFRERRSFWRKMRSEPGEPPLWDRPVVILIDERSRSAKEILAYRVRQTGAAILVGQRTEGAVLGAVFHALPDGSYLELAGVAVPEGGVSLEGVGVMPHHEVDLVVPYARGKDTIFEKGCDVAAQEVRRQRATSVTLQPF
ncbi:MAG: S41 family peptidase [Planctomycetota bacterium]